MTILKKKTILNSILVILLLGLTIIDIRVCFWGINIYGKVQGEKEILSRLSELEDENIENINPEELINLSKKSIGNLEEIQSGISPFFPLLNLPVMGPVLNQVDAGLNYGLALSFFGQYLGESVSPVWAALQTNDGKTPVNELVSQAFLDAQPNLVKSREYFNQAVEIRKKLNPDVLPVDLANKIRTLDSFIPEIQKIIDISLYIPDIIGNDEPQTYLIMVQNRDELRATGGYITSFGLLRLEKGKITLLEFEDSTHLNYMATAYMPPEPIHTIMMASYWVPRDGNWSPDFPTAAYQTQKLYYSSTGYPTDGVIAIDQGFLVALINLLGPITLDEDQTLITTENLESKMITYKQEAIYSDNYYDRKSFIGRLGSVVMKKVLQERGFDALYKLGNFFYNQTRSGHLMFYSNRPEIQKIIENEHAAGKIDPGEGDFLMLADSNIGFSKNDKQINRSIQYQVDLRQKNTPKAIVTIKYENMGIGDEPCSYLHSEAHDSSYYFPRCYWDYWRLYLNRETKLEKSDYSPAPASYFEDSYRWDKGLEIENGEGGTLRIGGLSVVPQMETRQVSFWLILPANILQPEPDGRLSYRLRIQKQGGIDAIPVSLTVYAPQEYKVKSSSLGVELKDQFVFQWQGAIENTGDIEIVFAP